MEGTIRLRGHHIASLAEYFFSKRSAKRVDTDYSPEFGELLRNVFDYIITNPSTHVRIVGGPEEDVLCSSEITECPKKAELGQLCDSTVSDPFCLEEYRLSIEDTPTSKEIMDMIKKYTEETDFISPREKMRFMF